MDQRYHRDERLIIRIAVVAGCSIGLIAVLISTNLRHGPEPVKPAEIWSFIDVQASRSGLDPEFVYAIAWAESSLDAKARSSVARGVMQLTKSAWREVTDESYRQAWNWRTNVRIGVDYLVYCREYLIRHDAFSYPLLAASYRYGPNYVKVHGFDISRLKVPKNSIYKAIFEGSIRPVPAPVE